MTVIRRQFTASLSLIQLFSKNRKLHRGNRYPLPMQLSTMVLYGMYCGWPDALIARMARTTAKTVRKRRNAFFDDPSLIFNVPVLITDMRWKTMVWRCQFCESVLEMSERKAREHVVDHVLPREAIANGVMPK